MLTVQVSDEDADLAKLRWHLAGGKSKDGAGKYPRGIYNGEAVYLHRLVADRMGLAPSSLRGQQIDHANGDKLDNRRENLRSRTRNGQARNSNDPLRSDNRSGRRGVSFIKGRGKWYASGQLHGRTTNLGLHETFEGAVAAREKWEAEHWDRSA